MLDLFIGINMRYKFVVKIIQLIVNINSIINNNNN